MSDPEKTPDPATESEPEIIESDSRAEKSGLDAEVSNKHGGTLAVPGDVLPVNLHLLPLPQRPFFPIQSMPLVIPADPWAQTLAAVGETPQRALGLVLVRPDSEDPPAPDRFHRIGTAVRVHNASRQESGVQFIAEGIQRFRIERFISNKPPYVAQVRYIDDQPEVVDTRAKAHAMAILSTLKELLPLNPLYNEELRLYVDRFSANRPATLAYFAANLTTAPGEALQEILEIDSMEERLERVLDLLHKELDVARLQSEIREQVEQRIGKQQREFFLREQLKEIQKELGIAKDDRTAEADRFRERMQKLEPSEAVIRRVDEELDKFSVLETGSPEYAVTRNYLDWMTSLPWGKHSRDRLDLARARRVLNADHFGLADVKERIIEFIALAKLRGKVAGSILLLVGPPGVGKTSIGRSVAEALGRKFYRFSVGGMRDEAEIKGHRRTYIGAMPGKFVQALKDVETANPVLMLDEVDKIGASYHGDPASALLEALDPEQNADFLDHYLDVRFDLSNVLFVCTANQLDTIPGPLLDRMEVIRLGGYITEEKVEIAKRHLWPRQLERAGMKSSAVRITDSALRAIAEGYARESGVRNLDKQLGRIIRKSAVRMVRSNARSARDGKRKTAPIRLSNRNLEEFLGKPVFSRERVRSGVGVVTGLAWTAMGGVTLSVESTLVHSGNRGFKLTGQLGNVMRESAEIAYSYVAAHLKEYDADLEFFDKAFVHLHVPEGATPKDGPSAGVTMATALLSLARNQRLARPVSRPAAMTGELTLTGDVLPVGGIREKVIAARRAGIKELFLPEANRPNFEELPSYLRDGMLVHFASHYQQIFEQVFRR